MTLTDQFGQWLALNRNDPEAADAKLAEMMAAIPPEPADRLSPLRTELAGLAAEGGDLTEDRIAGALRRHAPDAELPALPFEGEPLPRDPLPEREWLIRDAVPAARLASLHGPGAAGKSSLALQIAAAIMNGGSPVELDPEIMAPEARAGFRQDNPLCRPVDAAGRVLWLSWEDETAEIVRRWRLARAAGAIDEDRPDPKRLTLVDMRRIGAPLWAPETGGSGHVSSRATWTDAGRRFLRTLKGHRLAIVDPLAAAFASNENDRALVRAFCAAIDGEAEAAGCAVLLIAHPPKAAADYSGSTDWRNAVRSMLTLEVSNETGHVAGEGDKPPPARAHRLRPDKSSYGPLGQHLWLRRHWQRAEGGSSAQLAWFGTTAGLAAEAYEGRPAESIADRAARKANGRDGRRAQAALEEGTHHV